MHQVQTPMGCLQMTYSFVHVLTLYFDQDNEPEIIGVFTSRKEAQEYVQYEDDWGGHLEIKRMKLNCVTALYR